MSRGLMRSATVGAPDIGWAVTAALLVAIGGVPPLASALLGVVLLGQAAIGERAMRRARWWGEAGWQERLLLRVVVGAVVATAVDQVSRVLLGPGALASSAWWIVALAAVAVPERARTRRGETPAVASGDSARWRDWIWLAVIACVLLAHEVLWTFETAVALTAIGVAAAGAVGGRRVPTLLRGGLVVAGVAVAWWGIDRRPAIRLLPDDRFFARVVWSLGEWGVSTNPFALGEPFRYHWASYAWLGLLSRASGGGAEMGIRSVGPIVVAMLCAVGLVALALRCGAGRRVAIAAAGVAAACDTYAITGRGRGFHIGWVESFSQFASVPLLVAALLWLARVVGRARSSDAVAFAAVVVAIGAVKVSAAAVVVAATWGAVVWSGWRRRGLDLTEWAMLAATGASAVLTATLFSDPVGNTTLGTGVVRPYWPVGFVGDLWRWYVDSLAKWTIVMGLLLVALCIAIPFAIAQAREILDAAVARVIGATLIAGSTAGLALTVLMPPSDNPFYALHDVAAIAWVAVAVAVCRAIGSWRRSATAPIWLVVGVAIGVVTIRGDVEFADPDRILWVYVARPAIPALTVALIAMMSIVRRRGGSTAALGPALLALVAASVTLGVLNWRDQRASDYREWRRASPAQVEPDLATTRTWILSNAPETAIVASTADVLTGGDGRREVAPLPTTELIDAGRMITLAVLRDVAGDQTCSRTRDLVGRGAGYFVATAEEAAVGALDACATRVYENPSYVVYELAKAP